MELILHAGRFRMVLLKGVDDGLISLAHIKRDEVSCTVVPRATSRGNGCMCGFPGWGEVASAVLPSGCFSFTEDLMYLRLLKQQDGRVELE